MPISPTTPLSPQVLPPATSSPNGSRGNLPNLDGASPPGNVANAQPSDSKSIPESVRVTLSVPSSTKSAVPEIAPVYAEIWKDGVKVAQIDVHGGVHSIDNLYSSAPGSSGAGGTLLAARRAIEVARALGGEIRVGGQSIDGQTLRMQAKLRVAYGT